MKGKDSREPGLPLRFRRFFYGIRFKMMVGLFVVFLASGFLLYALVMRQMNRQLSEQIGSEMNQLWQNTNIYARQLMLTSIQNSDETGFSAIWSDLEEGLRDSWRYSPEAFDPDGTPLEAGTFRGIPEEEKRLFEAAGKGRAACRMVSDAADRCQVTFVMPVIVLKQTVGILRFEADYSQAQQANSRFARRILQGAALVFAVSFLLCFLILGGILNPLPRLTRLSRRVTEMMEREEIEALPTVRRSLSSRRDEIGELALGYSQMLATIRRQFCKIEGDKERMRELLDSRQQFFDNATHELKTPLTTIQGYAQLIQADGGEDRELLENGLTHILHESARLHQMVVQLLEMSENVPEGERRALSLMSLMREVAAAMELKAGRYGNTFVLSGDEDAVLLGDENRIRQLLINLIDNAIKYGEENAPISLSAERRGDEVILTVGNRGREIPKEALSEIFTPFYRVDKEYSRERGSAGLGLAICQRIVKSHGGQITAESSEGHTTFRVTFPAWVEDGREQRGE